MTRGLAYSDLVDVKRHGKIVMQKSRSSQMWVVLLGTKRAFTFTQAKKAENKFERLVKVYGERK
jgi:hypothetical protein